MRFNVSKELQDMKLNFLICVRVWLFLFNLYVRTTPHPVTGTFFMMIIYIFRIMLHVTSPQFWQVDTP